MQKIYCDRIILQCSFVIFCWAILPGCADKGKPKKESEAKRKTTTTQYSKPPSSVNDTLMVTNTAAVFYTPDSMQLSEIKEIMTQEEYETDVHNCFYLMRNARNVMKQYWPNLKIIEANNIRYLLFIKADKTRVLVDLNLINDSCGIYLFDQNKDPELADMMNIDTALGFYFKK